MLIERDQQMKSLQEAFAAVLEGKRQFVCIPGEAWSGQDHSRAMRSSRKFAALRPRGSDAANAWRIAARWSRTSRSWRRSGGCAASRTATRWPPCFTAAHRRGSHKCRGWPTAQDLAQLPQRNLGVTRNRMLREFAELVGASQLLFRPLVLSLDDLHWSDDSTLSLLEFLARRDDPAQLMLIGTYRPAEATRARQPLEALALGMKIRGQCHVVRPDLLSAAAVQSMIDCALPGIAPDRTLVDTVHRRTGGNPLFVLALIDHWKATSAVVPQPDGWRAAADFVEMGESVPQSLTAMIHQKMETLSPEEQLLLEACQCRRA